MKVALAPFLRDCSDVITLGVRASVGDYTEEERNLLHRAERIFFPTPRFTEIFAAIGKPTFPCPTTYRYQHSTVLQQILFQHLECPQPRSRIYFGARQKRKILIDFDLPCVAMGPDVAPDCVSLVKDARTLEVLARRYNPLIIREAVEWKVRIRMVWVQYECISVLREVPMGSGDALVEPIALDAPNLQDRLAFSRRFLKAASLDDIELEWGFGTDLWQLIGMKRPPVRLLTPQGSINRHDHVCGLIRMGWL